MQGFHESRLYRIINRNDWRKREESQFYKRYDSEREKFSDIVEAVKNKADISEADAIKFLNIKDGYGKTLLHYAADSDNLKVAQRLIAAGANIEIKDDDGHTPLFLAMFEKHDRMFQMLINVGANIEAKDKEGCTPLFTAVFYNLGSMFRVLVDRGANIQVHNKSGWSLLHAAAYESNSNRNMIEELIRNGLDIKEKAKDGKTPLHLAVIGNGKSIKDHTIVFNDTDKPLERRREEMKVRVDEGKRIIALLLEKGAEINAQDKLKRTPLHYAAESYVQNLAQCLILMDMGYDMKSLKFIFAHVKSGHNKKTGLNNPKEALMTCDAFGIRDIFDFLIQKDANVNAIDKRNKIPSDLIAYWYDKTAKDGCTNVKSQILTWYKDFFPSK